MKKIFFILIYSMLLQQSFARKAFVQRFLTNELSLDDRLFGTLFMPKTGSNFPLVIIIAGSGPTDRNGNSNMGLQTNCYTKLADSLVMKGIACFRFDKRGVAESADSTMKEDDMSFDTYIADTKAWINYLKENYTFSKIIIAGHSEGSLVGMQSIENANAFISIAGPGESIDKTLKKQLKGKLGPLEPLVMKQMDSLKAGKKVTCTDKNLMSVLRPSVQPYMISWMKYDPAKTIASIKKPCLIVQGSKDLQVKSSDAQLLKKANPKAQMVLIKKMNHVLVDVDGADDENMITYSNPDLPLNATFVKTIVQFVNKVK
jgi:uncharacterized protein